MSSFFEKIVEMIGIFSEDKKEGFGNLLNGFHFNNSCMVVTVLFLIIFIYKEELMKTKIIKGLIK
jgi:hypothetical protein